MNMKVKRRYEKDEYEVKVTNVRVKLWYENYGYEVKIGYEND